LRFVKSHGKIFFVTHSPRLETAKRFLEESKAERVLAQMELFEDVAELWETEGVPGLKQRFATQYRKLMGVGPEHRGEFRAELERIKDGGGGSIQDAIDRLKPRATQETASRPAQSDATRPLREQLRAETLLAKMDLHREFLDLWSTEREPGMRAFYAAKYRKVFGVDPERHAEFRQAVEAIRDGGADTVQAAIERLQLKRSS
jgi:hypothetical protein